MLAPGLLYFLRVHCKFCWSNYDLRGLMIKLQTPVMTTYSWVLEKLLWVPGTHLIDTEITFIGTLKTSIGPDHGVEVTWSLWSKWYRWSR